MAPSLDTALTDPRDLERPQKASVVIESTGAIDFNPDFASYAARAVGLLVDAFITLAAVAPGVFIATRYGGAMRVVGVLVSLVGILLIARWYGVAVSKSGQWIGNRISGTKVVEVSSGDLLDPGYASTRFLIRMLVSPVLLFGYILAFTNSQRRAFHDQFVGSIVTRPSRASWSVDDVEPIDNAVDRPSSQ